MNRVTLIVPFLVLMNLLAGCKSDNPVQQNISSDIAPLALGNRWIGRLRYLDANGSVRSQIFDTLQIVEVKDVSGEKWYLTNQSDLLALRQDGLWSHTALVSFAKPVLVAKFPATAGERFSLDTTVYNGDTITHGMVVASTNLHTIAPYGTYDCYQYKDEWRHINGALITGSELVRYDSLSSSLYEDFNDLNYTSYAPGVGYVKREWFNRRADGSTYVWYRWELVDVRKQ